jgi:hypothetical protein
MFAWACARTRRRAVRLCGGLSGCEPRPSVWPRSVHEIPGRRFQLAAVEADIEQRAVIELVDAGELGAIAKISPDGVEQECSEHGPGFPLIMSMAWRRAIARIGHVNGALHRSIGNGSFPPFPMVLRMLGERRVAGWVPRVSMRRRKTRKTGGK